MMPIHWGVGMWQVPPQQLIEVVQLCERLGYDQFWHANHKLNRDMTVGLTLAAVYSQRLKLGTFVVDPYVVHPAMTAAAVATLDELSGGRAVLVLGAGMMGFRAMGFERRKPLVAVEEAIHVIRRLWAGETVSLAGEVVQVREARLGFAARPDIPIVIAARGNRMLRLAGRLADGAMISTYATPEGVRYALSQVAQGVKEAGRLPESVTVILRVDACIHEDVQAARAAVKPIIGGSLGSRYPDRAFVEAVGLSVPAQLEAIVRAGDEGRIWAAASLVPDEFVEQFAWAGTAEQVAAQVARVIDMGITHVTILPNPPEAVIPTLSAFANEVMPKVIQPDGLNLSF
ncbi:MAG: LLM class flavin-dependent oxidoreductase [Chloroflexi bacterium]|nr:LLM class flavin-dependent oxidoreductase [Chloroflexota bacterium]